MGICRLLLAFLTLALLAACTPPPQTVIGQMAEMRRDSDQPCRLSCFLVLKESDGPAVRLEVTAIEALADTLWLPVASRPVQIDSAAIGAGQFFLGSRPLPPGNYHRLRLTVASASIRQSDGSHAVIAAEPFKVEVPLPAPLPLSGDDSRTILLTWDVESSLAAGNVLQPVLEAVPQVKQLLVDLVFVACPDIDTIFVVRADRSWVVDSFGLKGRPTYLALDPDPGRQRLYVLASGEAKVKVVDLTSFRMLDMFPVPLGDMPTYMTVSADGRSAYLLDERSGYLSRLDLTSGRSAARVRLGFRPQYAAFLDLQNLLAVSLSVSQTVVLLDPLNLNTVGTLATGGSPQGLLAVNNQLYIAEYGDHSVSIVDLGSRQIAGRVAVGFGPRRLLATESLIYAGNFDNGSLSVLAPGQLGVIRDISGMGRPLEMVFDPLYRRLYAADDKEAALAVIDVNSNLLVGRIDLGARPAGLAVIR